VAKFLLKAGSFLSGSGAGRKKYNHADPNNNVVESDKNLAAKHPEKFERIEQYEDGPYQYNPQANRRGQDPAELQARAGVMPSLGATTGHRVNKRGATLDDQYGNLDDMEVADLKQVAEAEEIPLPKNLTKKEDIVRQLRGARGQAGTQEAASTPASTSPASAPPATAKEGEAKQAQPKDTKQPK
jgi:hypothetical protein